MRRIAPRLGQRPGLRDVAFDRPHELGRVEPARLHAWDQVEQELQVARLVGQGAAVELRPQSRDPRGEVVVELLVQPGDYHRHDETGRLLLQVPYDLRRGVVELLEGRVDAFLLDVER